MARAGEVRPGRAQDEVLRARQCLLGAAEEVRRRGPAHHVGLQACRHHHPPGRQCVSSRDPGVRGRRKGRRRQRWRPHGDRQGRAVPDHLRGRSRGAGWPADPHERRVQRARRADAEGQLLPVHPVAPDGNTSVHAIGNRPAQPLQGVARTVTAGGGSSGRAARRCHSPS